MKTKYNPLVKRSLIVVGCLMLFAMTSRGTDPVSHQSFLDQLRTFEKMGDQDREACLDENAQYMLRMKEILLHNLVSTNDGVRFYSAFFLGVYRFPEAASPLASIISVEDNMKWRHLPAWGRYPAMSALMRIGNPSIPAVIGQPAEYAQTGLRPNEPRYCATSLLYRRVISVSISSALSVPLPVKIFRNRRPT